MKERISDEFKEVKEEFEDYINRRVDLVKLDVAENLSRFLSGMIIKTVLSFLLFFVLLFVSMGFAFWLGHQFESQSYGFLVVGGFYILVGLLFWVFRRAIIAKPVIKSFVQLFFPERSNYDETK